MTTVPLDVADGEAVTRVAQDIQSRCGRVDILVNSAGVNVPRRYWNQTDSATFDAVVAINLNCAMACTLAVLPGMGYALSGFDGKVAVVTGAGRMRSIGRPIALALARAGCDRTCATRRRWSIGRARAGCLGPRRRRRRSASVRGHKVCALSGRLSSDIPAGEIEMARLNLEAVVSKSVARVGTADPVWATVSVTRSSGVPVTTLTRADFIVGNTWGPFAIEVTFFQHVGQVGQGSVNAGGLYMMRLTPIPGGLWTSMPLHLVFVVQTPKDHGQTIAELAFA